MFEINSGNVYSKTEAYRSYFLLTCFFCEHQKCNKVVGKINKNTIIIKCIIIIIIMLELNEINIDPRKRCQ